MQNPGIKNGVIAGLFMILGGLISYFIDPRLYLKPSIQWGLMLVYIVFMYRAGVEARDANGGFISWGGALTPIFTTGAVAALIAAVFQYVLYNFLDPSLMDLQMEMSLEAIEQMSGFIGEEATEEAMERLEAEGVSFGIGTMMMGWAVSCLIGFIPSAIIAAIVKREDPNQGTFA